jgi:hypothetical protein
MPLMRKFRAVAGIAVVWGIGGMILGATLALVVLRLRNPGWLSPGEIVWMVARRDGITLALAGAAFAISLGVWSKLSSRRTSGKGWIAAGAVGAAMVSNLMVVPRLLALHIPVPIFGVVALQSAMAIVATVGTVVVAERSARRAGGSLIGRRDATGKPTRPLAREVDGA